MKQSPSNQDWYNMTPWDARAIAMSAGDLTKSVRLEVQRVMNENKNNFWDSINQGLQELLERNLIKSKELEDLKKLCKKLMNAKRKTEDVDDTFLWVLNCYHKLVIDANSSPTAIAIVGAVSSTFELVKSNSFSAQQNPGQAQGALYGGMLGAAIGQGFGGGLGMVIGAAIGAAIGAIGGWCNEQGGD